MSPSPRRKTSPSIENKASTSKKAIFSKNITPHKIASRRDSSGEPYDNNDMAQHIAVEISTKKKIYYNNGENIFMASRESGLNKGFINSDMQGLDSDQLDPIEM